VPCVRVYHAPCDVASHEAVRAFVKQAEDELGPVRALVNSAGIVRDKPLALMERKDWSAVLDTNLTGTFNFCHSTVLGLMKRRVGAVVNISSVAGVYGNAAQTNYAATKAGIIGMSKALAKEVGPYGIRVNVVAPGFIETDMTASVAEKARERLTRSVALGRPGQVQHVADAVAFLLSDQASYITGHVLHVDGGIAL
jgi:3-oxoacyl-[acyl-carrier protein] reductase